MILLPGFEQTDDTDKPLPEIIASQEGFALQFHDVDNGRFYAVQDWIKGIAKLPDGKAASKFWNAMKRRIEKAGIDSSTWCRTLPYKATDGKTYQRDYADSEHLYQIVQRMDAETGIRNKVLSFLAKAGVFVDEVRLNPENALNVVERRYIEKQIRRGMIEHEATEALRERRNGREDFKALMAAIQVVCTDTTVKYGKVVNAEYLALFGQVAEQLEKVLKSKSIRDDLPPLQYSYIRTAELGFREILKHRKRMSMDEICIAMRNHALPLGRLLQDLCQTLGINHVTGKPLLPSDNGASQ